MADISVNASPANPDELIPVQNPYSSRSTCPFMKVYRVHYPPGFHRKMVSEVISTFMLVFVTAGSAAISVSDQTRVPKLGASIAGGLIITVMIYAVGHISGAHMNPAVTTAFASARHFPWKQVPMYAVSQLTGAISAGYILRLLLHPIKRIGTTAPSGGYAEALVMEIIVTFCMMFVTCAVATDTKAVGELAGIAVGSSVCISSILGGPVSGGSMNPARTLGPAIASSYYKGIWIYIVGPLTGTVSGAWAYNFIRTAQDKNLDVNPSNSLKLRRARSNDQV